jgi:mannose-1-phosphate guanylyltransferase/mannose-6-phosphate isomerase
MTQHITPVILCGGSGTRLWPLSRTGFPKQFLCLSGNDSLFQQAAQRLNQLGNAHIQVSPPLIVTGEEHRDAAIHETRHCDERAMHRKVHRLANPGSIPLEIIEVQSGSDLGEDDIVWFEGKYGRSAS